MARITINEISQNYSYAIGSSSYAEVALPITSCWGPGFTPYQLQPTKYHSDNEVLEETEWMRFRSNNEGIEKFVSTFRGKPSFADDALDKSFESALTLLSSGYDVLVCRLSCGSTATGILSDALTHLENKNLVYVYASGSCTADSGISSNNLKTFAFSAKYPGSFGNNISIKVSANLVLNVSNYTDDGEGNIEYDFITDLSSSTINVVVYVDYNGSKQAVENFSFSMDSVYEDSGYISITQSSSTSIPEDSIYFNLLGDPGHNGVISHIPLNVISGSFSGGDDGEAYATQTITGKETLGALISGRGFPAASAYATAASAYSVADIAYIREWTYAKAALVLGQLSDKLSYSPDRVMHVWDDQDYKFYGATVPEVGATNGFQVSPLDLKVAQMACDGRCDAAFVGTPRSLTRDKVKAYAERLSYSVQTYTDDGLASTHTTMFGPWGRIRYQGTSLMATAHPAFLACMLMRSMSLNSSIQYQWALPTDRKVTLELGNFDYKLSQAQLDSWQSTSGVGINALVKLPDLGTCIWGNSTLFNVPEATYNALQNLSTRLLFNELRDWSYRCGLSITFQYNNAQAYSAFYAGMVPILDTMHNVGAIQDYRIQVNAELDELGQVMANSVIGKIYLVVNGVVNDLTVDLIAMPAGTVLA